MVQLKYLHEKGCNLNSDCCTCAAAAAGQVEVLEFLQNVGCKRNIDTCCTAAKWGQVKVLKWLKGIGIEPNSETFAAAAHGRDSNKYHESLPNNIHEREIRQMEVLTYLLENKCPWDHRAFEDAAFSAPIKVLEFLMGNGCPWSPKACEHAARFHRTETLKWFKYNGYEWDHYDNYLKEIDKNMLHEQLKMMFKHQKSLHSRKHQT